MNPTLNTEMEAEQDWIAKMEDQRRKVEIHEIPTMTDKSGFYRTPSYSRAGQDQSLFYPRKVSIGPYHYGTPYCEQGQRDKQKCLPIFLSRFDVPLQVHMDSVRGMVDEIRGKYYDLDADRWLGADNTSEFLRMMILDACFILEVMIEAFEVSRSEPSSNYAFDVSELETYKCDMLIFDNQIPLKVLACICENMKDSWTHKSELKDRNAFLKLWPFSDERMSSAYFVTQLVRYSLSPTRNDFLKAETEIELHILDVYERSLRCHQSYTKPHTHILMIDFSLIPSATQLEEAQIGISNTLLYSGFSILFRHTTLGLSRVVFDHTAYLNFHNVLLYERLHPRAGYHFSSYIFVLSHLLKDAADSRLLRMRGILNTTLPDEKVVELINRLSDNISFRSGDKMDERIWNELGNLINSYIKNSQPWRKDLFQQYLRSPWAIISVFVGFVIVALTVLQTAYTILGYYKGNM